MYPAFEKFETKLFNVYGFVTNKFLLVITLSAKVEYPNDGMDIVVPTTEPVQFVVSFIDNRYVVGAVNPLSCSPILGDCAIPSNEPVCVIVEVTLLKIGFTISFIVTSGLR